MVAFTTAARKKCCITDKQGQTSHSSGSKAGKQDSFSEKCPTVTVTEGHPNSQDWFHLLKHYVSLSATIRLKIASCKRTSAVAWEDLVTEQ